MTRTEQVRAAHDSIVQRYADRAFAALDRGDREAADRWLARMERAERKTDEHIAFVEITDGKEALS